MTNEKKSQRTDETVTVDPTTSLTPKKMKRVAVRLQKGAIRFVRLEGYPSVAPKRPRGKDREAVEQERPTAVE